MVSCRMTVNTWTICWLEINGLLWHSFVCRCAANAQITNNWNLNVTYLTLLPHRWIKKTIIILKAFRWWYSHLNRLKLNSWAKDCCFKNGNWAEFNGHFRVGFRIPRICPTYNRAIAWWSLLGRITWYSFHMVRYLLLYLRVLQMSFVDFN